MDLAGHELMVSINNTHGPNKIRQLNSNRKKTSRHHSDEMKAEVGEMPKSRSSKSIRANQQTKTIRCPDRSQKISTTINILFVLRSKI